DAIKSERYTHVRRAGVEPNAPFSLEEVHHEEPHNPCSASDRRTRRSGRGSAEQRQPSGSVRNASCTGFPDLPTHYGGQREGTLAAADSRRLLGPSEPVRPQEVCAAADPARARSRERTGRAHRLE